MNLYHHIAPWSDGGRKEIHVVIDIPKGGSNKYEYDEEGGYFKLDRVLHHQMFYPFDYGFVPQTKADDGDAIDVCLLTTYPTFPGCVIKARVIGALDTKDEKGGDLKVLAVPTSKVDPRFDDIKDYTQLGRHFLKELNLHFKEIKKLEEAKYPHVVIDGFKDREHALKTIEEAVATYTKEHKGSVHH